MRSKEITCRGCYWEESCGCEQACDDYTPMDETERATAFYRGVLRENAMEYRMVIAEQNI